MSEIWIVSDLHLSHNKTFLYEPRGFDSIEEMNEAIVERWNQLVKPEDIVYNLGDIALTNVDTAIPYIKRLNGYQWWIRGNHDTLGKIQKIMSECSNISTISNPEASWATMIKSGKWNFYLSHYPTRTGNFDDTKNYRIYCLCGHSHTQDKFIDIKDNCYHVEMDAHKCCPINIEDIKNDIRQYYINNMKNS